MKVPECGECGQPLELCCPCSRLECKLTTAVPFCPKCEKTKLGKWQTAHSISVCNTYLEDQLG